uniref:sigma-70 family RNA polymerase sigma factor n=2 Tax=Bacteria TaxID=2 RepID=UPI004029C9C1
MAYNKARAEKQWLKWKEAEERKLRELGVDEDTIQRLHTYDWAQFNKERQYLQRQVEWSHYVDWVSAQDLELPVEDTEALLDSIEDMELFSLLHNMDKLTLEILFMKMDGYGSKEISEKTG